MWKGSCDRWRKSICTIMQIRLHYWSTGLKIELKNKFWWKPSMYNWTKVMVSMHMTICFCKLDFSANQCGWKSELPHVKQNATQRRVEVSHTACREYLWNGVQVIRRSTSWFYLHQGLLLINMADYSPTVFSRSFPYLIWRNSSQWYKRKCMASKLKLERSF